MKVLGVAGGIGSGKSVVCQIFRTLGIPVFDSDREAKACYNDLHVQELVSETFEVELFPNGQLDREKLASIVFTDKRKLQALNEIIHPEVAIRFDRWCSRQNAPFVIKEAAILFETGGQEICTQTALVISPQHLRIARITKRDGLSEGQVRDRMKNQWSDEDKMKLADFVVTNDKEHALIPQVKNIFNQVIGFTES
ncbi:MAG: dephospho-CoA kinase [Flavobacteriales bacterium]|jgi:dephospho-CoA kinase